MTLLNAAKSPDHSPWHVASGIVVTLLGTLVLMVSVSYLVY